MFPQGPNVCWHCGEEIGSLLHIIWSYPSMHAFWSEVSSISQKFTDHAILWDPAFFLRHHHYISRKTYRHLILPINAHCGEKKGVSIPLLCKKTQAPLISMSLTRVPEINEIEDPVPTKRGLHDKFLKKCFFWHDFTYTEEYPFLLD